jgi:hypothetical protein
MNKGKKDKDLKEFGASLREGLKYARGKKAKVKTESIGLLPTPSHFFEARHKVIQVVI